MQARSALMGVMCFNTVEFEFDTDEILERIANER
jgi:hypothetical protein